MINTHFRRFKMELSVFPLPLMDELWCLKNKLFINSWWKFVVDFGEKSAGVIEIIVHFMWLHESLSTEGEVMRMESQTERGKGERKGGRRVEIKAGGSKSEWECNLRHSQQHLLLKVDGLRETQWGYSRKLIFPLSLRLICLRVHVHYNKKENCREPFWSGAGKI